MGCAWAVAYVPIHVYWAVTGSTWPLGELAGLDYSTWRATNWAASVVITGAAVVSLALVRPWGRRLPRWMLLGVAALAGGFAVLHAVGRSTQILLLMAGVGNGPVTTFDRLDLLVFEPWFLVMGVLLVVAARQHARRNREAGSDRSAPAPASRAGMASAAMVLIGAFVILVGVMTFEPWVYAAAGPVLLGGGLLGRLLTRRRSAGEG